MHYCHILNNIRVTDYYCFIIYSIYFTIGKYVTQTASFLELGKPVTRPSVPPTDHYRLLQFEGKSTSSSTTFGVSEGGLWGQTFHHTGVAEVCNRTHGLVLIYLTPFPQGGGFCCDRFRPHLHLYHQQIWTSGSARPQSERSSPRGHVHLDHPLHGQRDNNKLPTKIRVVAYQIQNAAVESQRLSQTDQDRVGSIRVRLVFRVSDSHRFFDLWVGEVYVEHIRYGAAGFA